jgi:hypothetical protein
MNYQAAPSFIFDGNEKEALEYCKTIFNGEVSGTQTFVSLILLKITIGLCMLSFKREIYLLWFLILFWDKV